MQAYLVFTLNEIKIGALNRVDESYLLNQVRQGHKESFRIIADQWYPEIYRFAYRFMGNREDALDIAQKTMIKIHQNIQSLEKTTSFRAWIYRVANNLCLDELKRAGRRRSRPFESSTLESQIQNNTPEHKLETKELNEIIRKALNELPEELRPVVILKQFEDLTFREISEILQIPENTAKTRMYKGLNQLSSILKKWNIQPDYLNND